MHFYSCPSSPFKIPGTIFWKSVSPKAQEQRGGGNYNFFIKIQSENMQRLGTLIYLYVIWFILFLNVMALMFSE